MSTKTLIPFHLFTGDFAAEELMCLDFGDFDHIFKVTGGQKVYKKCLVCTLSPEGINGFLPNLHMENL